ncbi:UNVERIFIED_CONTAM: Cullin-9, partial [Gekko kuhli]
MPNPPRPVKSASGMGTAPSKKRSSKSVSSALTSAKKQKTDKSERHSSRKLSTGNLHKSHKMSSMYEKALLRGYVECCSNLTWCTNPQGCDQILCKEGLGCGEACSKCSWISCFNCNFPEAHYPASCSHMSQWMDDGGYYEGMTVEAQSKHLAKLISKRCPSCQSQIEKNEGCLHMTCAKCNHGFCWRCLKPWKPTHKDYYNCSAMVSKAARQEKRFQDYNERCTFHHQAREFAMNLRNRVSTISDVPQIRTLTFVVDACKMLEQARKVLAYSCVYSYYNQDTEKMDIMEQQSENLELHTNALQILLEETLLQCQDIASSIRLLKAEHFNAGLELVRRIQERLLAVLQHATQDFRMGFQTRQSSEQREMKLSNVPNATPAYKAHEEHRYRSEESSEYHYSISRLSHSLRWELRPQFLTYFDPPVSPPWDHRHWDGDG